MISLIEILVFYSGILTIKYIKLSNTNKINYSNYKNCLKALAEYDKDLAKYLERDDDLLIK